jgi:hypothetical protein
MRSSHVKCRRCRKRTAHRYPNEQLCKHCRRELEMEKKRAYK